MKAIETGHGMPCPYLAGQVSSRIAGNLSASSVMRTLLQNPQVPIAILVLMFLPRG